MKPGNSTNCRIARHAQEEARAKWWDLHSVEVVVIVRALMRLCRGQARMVSVFVMLVWRVFVSSLFLVTVYSASPSAPLFYSLFFFFS